MNRQHAINTLEFQYHSVFNDQIETITTVKRNPLIDDWNSDLALETQSSQMEFVTQAFFVNGFEQSWTESLMNLNGSPDDLFS